MSVAIVTDSSVSLPPSMTQGLPLYIVPMEIHHDGAVYHDGVDLTPAAFYDLQRTSDTLPKTSAPSPGAFLEAYKEAAKHHDEIVCITLSSDLSATHGSAIAGRDLYHLEPNTQPVEIVDSRSAAIAEGLIALATAEAARDGADAATVAEVARSLTSEVVLYGALESLYYVWKGGRVPRVVMWMTKLLGVKPVLQLADGRIGMVERPRTDDRALDRIVALAESSANGRPARVAVMHADAPERADVLAERITKALQPRELFLTELTPVIGAHTGPGLVGCALQPL